MRTNTTPKNPIPPYIFKIVEAKPGIIDPKTKNLLMFPLHEFNTGNIWLDYMQAGAKYASIAEPGKPYLLYMIMEDHWLLLSDPDPVRFEQAHSLVQKLIDHQCGRTD
ncbi:hypothetical protein [Cesiribacter andamanensis]|uniref:Uncharacterized protein n=1 Tax=Cesiribacter andamanensis AMV16 TaxID=1279009 RepID=M7N1G5_9BACT|nr:hypothetical protein [Cesiribacter andamanensis]EMR02523.1 hypothetical protein ADICEAN_02330 [Cesiribacter andamanensis AMV16]